MTLLAALAVLLHRPAQAAQVVWVGSYAFRDPVVRWREAPMFAICTEDCPLPSRLEPSRLLRILKGVGAIPSVRASLPALRPKAGQLKVYFCFDSSEVLRAQLERIERFVRPRVRDWAFEVYGYACPIGPEDYNLRLSRRRARAVASVIRRLGGEVLLVRGMGEVVFDPRRYSESRCAVIKTRRKGGADGGEAE